MKERLFTILLFIGAFAQGGLAQQHNIDEIVELLHQGEIVYAEKLLSENLLKDSQDIDSRMLLGTVTDYTGDSEAAIKIWSDGLNNTESDFPLYMNIGETRLRQGLQGANAKFVNGLVQYTAAADSMQDMRYRTNQLKLAIEAFKKANQLYPYEGDPILQLANTYEHLKDHEKALMYWKNLSTMYPTHEDYKVGLADCELSLKHFHKAFQAYHDALALNPRMASAYNGLANYWVQADEWTKAEEAMQMAEFYKWLPAFCTMEYSPERYQRFVTLVQMDEDSPVKESRLKLLEKLIREKSDESTRFLLASCWYHEDHGDVENEIFDELEMRGKAAIPLLMQLARQSENTCTIGEAVKRLVNINAPGTFDLLVELLPQDRQPYNPMHIPESMAALGDERAIAYLVRELNPGLVRSDDSNNLDYITFGEGMRVMRHRAALALSAFNHPVAIEALKQGLKNPNVEAYCAAALYKLTQDEDYLDTVETFARKHKKDPLLADFFRLIDTRAAGKMVRKLS